MTDDPSVHQDPTESEPDPAAEARNETRIELRLAQAEAQIRGLQERMMELNAMHAAAKQRALWTRVFLLAALLGAFFFMRSLKGV